jgi:3-oxoacyl-[acyl-carrier-protein] synthase-3
MAAEAAKSALADAGLKPTELDAIIVATVTPDYPLPSTATLVQQKIGAGRGALMDVVAACSGFLYGVSIARAFVMCGQYRHVLVCGVEWLSSITNYEDRGTCVLFGDGSGAAIVSRNETGDPSRGILSMYLSGDGQYKNLLHIPVGGTLARVTHDTVDSPGRFIKMDGREIFKLAVREMADAADRVIAEAGVSASDIEALRKRLDLPPERMYSNIERFGNTSSASVPIALDEARRSGQVKQGSLILSVAFGGGLVWGAALYRL